MPRQMIGIEHWFSLAKTGHAFVLDCLGHDIVSGRLPEGSLMAGDAKLIERFKVSRTVLREVMKTLAAKGLIVARARVGTRITEPAAWNMFDRDVLRWHVIGSLDPAFVDQIFDIRLALEPLAAELAIKHATVAQIDYLYESLEFLNRQNQAVETFVTSRQDFHICILNASHHPFMRSIGNVVEASLVPLFRKESFQQDSAKVQALVNSCRSLAEAIRHGSHDEVRTSMIFQIKMCRDQYRVKPIGRRHPINPDKTA